MELILNKLFQNINFSKKIGMIIASPSNNPPYKYHWIRDSALVMRVIIDLYQKNNEYLSYIINYVENEQQLQTLNTISGLGEPKFNIDGTPFNGNWGRPQNDGPALRLINLIKIYNIMKKSYPNYVKNIEIIIINDFKYLLDNLNEISFDIWEEIQGWHFYTRIIQLKAIKDFIGIKDQFQNEINENILEIYEYFITQVKHHLDDNSIISSFNEKGEIIRRDDSSIFLAFCHIDFDPEILKEIPVSYCQQNISNLLVYFRNKYNISDLLLLGRYQSDKYYNGHCWIICSLALAQILQYNNKITDANKIINEILNIDANLNLAEQYDPSNKIQYSAEKLTWNYSELYFTLNNFQS